MKKYLISKYDAGTIACHYTVLYSLYSDLYSLFNLIIKEDQKISWLNYIASFSTRKFESDTHYRSFYLQLHFVRLIIKLDQKISWLTYIASFPQENLKMTEPKTKVIWVHYLEK